MKRTLILLMVIMLGVIILLGCNQKDSKTPEPSIYEQSDEQSDEFRDGLNLQDINDNLEFYGIKLMMPEEELLKNVYVDKQPENAVDGDAIWYWVNNLKNGERVEGGDSVGTEIINKKRVVTEIEMASEDSKCCLYGIRENSLIEEAKTTLKEKGFMEQSQDADESSFGNIFYRRGNFSMRISFFGDGRISGLRLRYYTMEQG